MFDPAQITRTVRPLETPNALGYTITISIGEPFATATLREPDGTILTTWPCLPSVDNDAIVIEAIQRHQQTLPLGITSPDLG